MSFAIDVNILLYASDSGSDLRSGAVAFLERCVSSREVFCLGWVTVMSYLRMVTHPGILDQPLQPADAMANVEALLAAPHARLLAEEEGFWNIYSEVVRALPVRGNLVPDAHLAALLRQHGVRRLYTLDRDFLKFDFLDVRNPFDEA